VGVIIGVALNLHRLPRAESAPLRSLAINSLEGYRTSNTVPEYLANEHGEKGKQSGDEP
jgi:hypothetical protein